MENVFFLPLVSGNSQAGWRSHFDIMKVRGNLVNLATSFPPIVTKAIIMAVDEIISKYKVPGKLEGRLYSTIVSDVRYVFK